MIFVFVDLDGQFVQAMQKYMEGRNNCEYYTGDVKSIKTSSSDKIAYITPSNVLHFMEAGLDRVYTREMFPETETIFRKIVKNCGRQSLVGKYYIPIGDGIMINPAPDKFLISVPTMLMPQSVKNTRNAYHATLAALYLCTILPEVKLVIPAMCCGWGKMTPEESAKQIWWAILDYEASNNKGKLQQIHESKGIIYSSTINTLNEQPLFYENTEFKNIPSHLITTARA